MMSGDGMSRSEDRMVWGQASERVVSHEAPQLASCNSIHLLWETFLFCCELREMLANNYVHLG